MCSLLLLISIVAGYWFLDETHPDMQTRYQPVTGHEENSEFGAPLAAVATAGSVNCASADLRAKSYGTFNDVDMHEDEEWHVRPDGKLLSPDEYPKVFTRSVVMLVIALGIFTYHSMTYDHLLPIFLQDEKSELAKGSISPPLYIPGGLGISTQTVGLIMSINGLIALAIQAIVFPIVTEWLGVWTVFILVTVLHPIAYFIVPFLAFLPSKLLFPGIYTCLTIRNLLSILAYPVLLILIKQASPANSVLGKINGLAASAGAACRTIAPPIAGYLYSIGSRIGFTGIAWWASALVAIVGALQLWYIHPRKHAFVSINAGAPCCYRQAEENAPEVVHVSVDYENDE